MAAGLPPLSGWLPDSSSDWASTPCKLHSAGGRAQFATACHAFEAHLHNFRVDLMQQFQQPSVSARLSHHSSHPPQNRRRRSQPIAATVVANRRCSNHPRSRQDGPDRRASRRGCAARPSGTGCAEPTVAPGGADPIAAHDAAPFPARMVPDEEQHTARRAAGPQRLRDIGDQLGPLPGEAGQRCVDGVPLCALKLPAGGGSAQPPGRRGVERGVDRVHRLGFG